MEKQILQIAQQGNVDILKKLHEHVGQNLHWSQCKSPKTGDTPLHFAAQENNLEIVKYLCESWLPQCISIGNNDGKTALHDAAQFHNHNIINYLLKNGANVNALKRADWTPLMLACAKLSDNIESTYLSVKTLIDYGAHRLISNKDGWTSIHLAARIGDIQVFKIIWQKSIDELCLKTKNGRTALHIAALHDRFALLSYLLQEITAEDLNMTDNCGNTIFHDAVLSGNVDLVKLLHEFGADIHIVTSLGLSVIHLAAQAGNIDVLKYLIHDCHFDINLKTLEFGSFTPLHCAFRAKQYSTIDLLIKLGADEFVLDGYGRLPKFYI